MSACASSTGSLDRHRIGDSQRLYLRNPLEAWPESTTLSGMELGAAFDALIIGGPTSEARMAADEALRSSSVFRPADLLLAQIDFVDGQLDAAHARLSTWVSGHPEYVPAVLLWGRLNEIEGDRATAYESYLSLADRLPLALRRAEDLENPATQDLLTALGLALQANRIGVGEALVERLEAWSIGSPAALQGRWLLSRAVGDTEAELEILRRLSALPAGGEEVLDRLASLELSHGDAHVALRLFERLVAENPADRERLENLARARFQWRLLLLPDEIAAMTESAGLSRSEFASLLYWLIPGVRSAAVASGWIATDILDVPVRRRQEIARVVNRGLMDVDVTMHRFDPARPVSRQEALAGLLVVLAQTRPVPSCVEELALSSSPSLELVCGSAASCKILDEVASCLPEAPVSGRDAREMFRKTLTVLPEN
jgi:tetratricopeptide (TPR) repeat protein